MLEQYLTIFYTVAVQFVPLIAPVLAVYLLVTLVASLFFDR